MSKKQPPSYPWYPSDFAGSAKVAVMTLEQEGAYRRLLDHEWQEGSIPDDLEALARICRTTTAHMEKLWKTVRKCFVKNSDEPETLVNLKLEKIRQEKIQFHAKQHTNGIKGGRPKGSGHSNPKETQTLSQKEPNRNPQPNPTQTQPVTQSITLEKPSHFSFPISQGSSPVSNSNTLNFVRPEEPPGAGERTNQKTPELLQRLWGPVEGYIRKNVTDDEFAEFYRDCRLLDLTALQVVLAIPARLLARRGDPELATAILTQIIDESGTGLLRGRALQLVPLEQVGEA